MHFLTKVFVVIATILSIALAALTIAYATNTDRIRRDYQEEKTRYATLQSQAASTAAQQKSEVARLNETISQAQNELSSVKGQITNLQQERSQVIGDRDRAIAERTSLQAKIDELIENGKTQTILLTNYREEVEALRKGELAFRQQRLDLEDRISDLESQREVLDQNYRALQEELAQIKTDSQGGRASAGMVSDMGSKPFTYAGPVIKGSVESVQKDEASGKLMAKLTVGTNDRIAKNMRLYVVRNNNFIGNLTVTQTDLGFSVAQFDNLNLSTEVQAGDIVVSRVQ
ncbi:MAG: hypothetical protein U0640_14760 [Phycisphaerales bacterium]